jgi:hypothetical protein
MHILQPPLVTGAGPRDEPHDWLHLKNRGAAVTICGLPAADAPEAIPLSEWGSIAEGVEWCPHCARERRQFIKEAVLT